ncbi:hypothetical protein [Streptomyces sp. NBC_01314]|uniref:hypothetical protein n=1 Tax=Streptomyces sp. NBC_01314 TaxID=2903821 RepID=UPI0030877BA8|nr:hypothetical protein OG622_19300 [Streptomyces sp. NBC_01314]
MTSAAALPGAGAVLRVVRGAATGRRLVRVALLAGGLFVLGVLCGARANAADQVPTSPPLPYAVTAAVTEVTEVTGTVGHAVPPLDGHAVEPVARDVVEPIAERVARPATDQVAGPVVEHVVQPVTDPVLRPVTERVVVPVGDLVESVTEGLAGVPSQLPPVSGVPSPPGMPGLSELPELPGWITSPVETPPVAVTPQEPGRAGAARPGPAVDGDGGSDGERATGPASVVYGPDVAVYGPGAAVGGAVAVSAPHRDAGVGEAPVVLVPAQQNPDGLPASALGRHRAVDNGGPRHAEPHAVVLLDRAPPSLVPGAPAADSANGTRDRRGSIPEFPG